MPNFKLIFSTTTTQGITFPDATVATDGGLTVVLQNGERTFCVPTENVVAVERIPDAPPPEPAG